MTTVTHPPMAPKLSEVRIDKSTDGMYMVIPVYNGFDRPVTSSYSCGKNKQLADRLRNAILGGVVCTNPTVEHDVTGKSYVSYSFGIRMRCANADLRRLGY